MRVLVIDDTVAVRERVAALLREIPGIAAVDEAGDAAAAFALARAAAPRLVVLDLHLGDSAGLLVLVGMKALPSVPRVAVLTNDASEHHRRVCLARGADGFFDKSKEFDGLLQLAAKLAVDRA